MDDDTREVWDTGIRQCIAEFEKTTPYLENKRTAQSTYRQVMTLHAIRHLELLGADITDDREYMEMLRKAGALIINREDVTMGLELARMNYAHAQQVASLYPKPSGSMIEAHNLCGRLPVRFTTAEFLELLKGDGVTHPTSAKRKLARLLKSGKIRKVSHGQYAKNED